MANLYDNRLLNITDSVEHTIYEVPINKVSTIIHSLYIVNTATTSIWIDLTIYDPANKKIYLLTNMEIPNGEKLLFDKNINLHKTNGYSLRIKSSAPSASVICSFIEIG